MISWRESDGWFQSEQPVFFPVFGQAIRVMVYTEAPTAAAPGVLTPAHLAAINALLTIPAERRAEWSAAVFADFQHAIESDECELDADDIPDRCQTHEDVWPLVRWNEVVVSEQGPHEDRFVLVHGRPGWRIEHGLQLLLKNERLLWVGRQMWTCSRMATGLVTTCRVDADSVLRWVRVVTVGAGVFTNQPLQRTHPRFWPPTVEVSPSGAPLSLVVRRTEVKAIREVVPPNSTSRTVRGRSTPTGSAREAEDVEGQAGNDPHHSQ